MPWYTSYGSVLRYLRHSPLNLAPVAEIHGADRDIAVNFQSCLFIALMIEIEINNLIHLFFRIVCVNAEHGNIKMGVLHGRVFPVNQPNLIFAVFIRKQQKIIRIRINMGEAVFDGVGINKILQQKNIPFRLLIILKNGRSSLPKVLIILDIAEKS